MWNPPTEKQLAQIPKHLDTEGVALGDKLIHMHFFLGPADWYVSEFDGEDLFFGFVDLGDPDMSEWGYFSLKELKELKVSPGFEVDRDLHWEIRKARKVEKIKTYDHLHA
jgi:predicted AlkP superfamily pyrophosphatase or phosphodiesterase